MKTQAAWVLAAALSTGAVAQTYAQGTNTTTGARHKPGGPMAELSFDKMDAKGDGKVTPDEFQAAHADMIKARFAAMDANGDGVLTKDEVEQARAAHRPGGKHGDAANAKPAAASTDGTPPVVGAGHKAGGPMAEISFDKMDAKGDGKVTLDEFQAAFAVMLKDRFTAMDTNGDGVLSKEEVEAARAAHRPQGQHGKRGDGATPPAANAAQK